MRRAHFIVALIVPLFLAGCSDQSVAPSATDATGAGAPTAPPVLPEATTITVPAGSIDALAAAIVQAGVNGTVVLEAGVHTESSPVIISAPVSIVGKPGAILESGLAPDPAFTPTLRGALHVLGASNVGISGLVFRGPGGATMGTAVMIENSAHVSVADNVMTNVQYGVLVQKGDFARIRGNTIDVTTDWQTGALVDAQGIIVINGRGVRVEHNTVANGVFGIWACDAKGHAVGNEVSACFVGLILCTVPQGSFLTSGGQPVGAERSCTQWQVRDNVGTGNFTAGLLVIDNANRNTLVNNSGSGNGTYDIELAGNSMRFGFLTPTSYENSVAVGAAQDILIKDCGLNNAVIGAIDLVDTSTDPCN